MRVPVLETLKLAAPVTLPAARLTPSTIGTGSPVTSSRCTSNATAYSRAAEGVHEMTRRDISGIAPGFDERFPFSRFQRLHDDVRAVPSIGSGAGRQREQHVLPARQHVRAMGLFTVFDAHEHAPECRHSGRPA